MINRELADLVLAKEYDPVPLSPHYMVLNEATISPKQGLGFFHIFVRVQPVVVPPDFLVEISILRS